MHAPPAANDLDARDPLGEYAHCFSKPPGSIYLDGNSLGLCCQPAQAALEEALAAWRERAILGWPTGPNPWFDMSRRVSALLAPILGAEPADVMVGQSTTVNLHQLLATFYDPGGPKPRILIDADSFPSDRYAVESHLRLRGRDPARNLVVIGSRERELIDEQEIIDGFNGVGLAVLPSVLYRSGQLLEMSRITEAARKRGAMVAWDLSHSAGIVPHRLRDDDIDLAFGCTYKYLNGGPGSTAFLFVHPRWRERGPGMAGWFGCDPDRQFDMDEEFHPAADAGRFLLGTPHIFSLAPLLGSLDLILRAGVLALRQKSLELTAYLRQQMETRLTKFGIEIITPTENSRCGGHLALAHPDAGRLSQVLRQRGVIPDFRPPNLLRLAPAPLYTSFAECEQAVAVLDEILTTKAHERLAASNERVT